MREGRLYHFGAHSLLRNSPQEVDQLIRIAKPELRLAAQPIREIRRVRAIANRQMWWLIAITTPQREGMYIHFEVKQSLKPFAVPFLCSRTPSSHLIELSPLFDAATPWVIVTRPPKLSHVVISNGGLGKVSCTGNIRLLEGQLYGNYDYCGPKLRSVKPLSWKSRVPHKFYCGRSAPRGIPKINGEKRLAWSVFEITPKVRA